VTVYINGLSVYSSTAISGQFLACNSPLIIGSVLENESFIGVMRDLRIWRVALTTVEVKYSMEIAAVKPTSDLIGCWPFHCFNPNAADIGLHHIDGTISGAFWV